MSESVALKRLSPAQKAAGVTTRFLHVSGIDPAALARDCALAALKAVFERYGALEHDNGLVVCAEKVNLQHWNLHAYSVLLMVLL